MSNIICPNCDQANAHGSKFCNNCGNRLPLSDKITCPNCQTPNAASLFYCDNCGARLVKENLPTEVEPDSEADEETEQTSIRPSDLFALPTRKPGDTGKLDPGIVPDWLRTGKRESDQQADSLDTGDDSSIDHAAEPTDDAPPTSWCNG